MATNPYRSSSQRHGSQAEEAGDDSDLLPALWIFWGVTALRLVVGLLQNGIFDTELSVALLIVLLAPGPLLKAQSSLRTR